MGCGGCGNGRKSSGRYRQSVDLLTGFTGDDGFGGQPTGATFVATLPCSVVQKSGTEIFNRDQLETVDTIEVETRYRSDINTENILEFEGNQYDIKRVQDVDYRKRVLVVTAERQIDE